MQQHFFDRNALSPVHLQRETGIYFREKINRNAVYKQKRRLKGGNGEIFAIRRDK